MQHLEQDNLAFNQCLDDNVQKAMSMGMLIHSPIKQTSELFHDVGLVVLNIMDDIHLLLCKVCNVCLESKPCQVHNHLLGHDNHLAPKRHCIQSHMLRISHHCLIILNSSSCKTFTLKNIPYLRNKSSCQWIARSACCRSCFVELDPVSLWGSSSRRQEYPCSLFRVC